MLLQGMSNGCRVLTRRAIWKGEPVRFLFACRSPVGYGPYNQARGFDCRMLTGACGLQVTILDPKEDKPLPVPAKGDEKAAAAARFAGGGGAATAAY
jgi:hypothetical protein